MNKLLGVSKEELSGAVSSFKESMAGISNLTEDLKPVVAKATVAVNDIGILASDARISIDKVSAEVRAALAPLVNMTGAVGQGAMKVNELLDKLLESMSSGSVVVDIGKQILTHSLGICASLCSLAGASDFGGVVAALTSLLSCVGLESVVIFKLLTRLQSSGDDEEEFECESEDVYAEADWAKVGELLTSLIGLAGKTSFLPDILVNFVNNASKAVRNMEAINKLVKIIEDILAEFGIHVSARVRAAREVKLLVEQISKEAEDIEMRVLLTPGDFNKPHYWKQFCVHFEAVMELDKLLESKATAEVLPQAAMIKMAQLVKQTREFRAKLVQLRNSAKSRPVPVGVCLEGPSSIGKSNLTTVLIDKVKGLLEAYARDGEDDLDFATGASSWNVWYQNSGDQYDQNYTGQEFHVCDDAFQAADQSDHIKFIQKISNTPMPTYQADLSSKGLPYTSKCVIVSCNVFPTASRTINSIDALKNRFPVHVKCALKPGHAAPQRGAAIDFDPTFPWLDLTVNGGTTSVEGLAIDIADRIVAAEALHESSLVKEEKYPMEDDDQPFDAEDMEGEEIPDGFFQRFRFQRLVNLFRDQGDPPPPCGADDGESVSSFRTCPGGEPARLRGNLDPFKPKHMSHVRCLLNPFSVVISDMRAHPQWSDLLKIKVCWTRGEEQFRLPLSEAVMTFPELYDPSIFYRSGAAFDLLRPAAARRYMAALSIPVVIQEDNGLRSELKCVWTIEGGLCTVYDIQRQSFACRLKDFCKRSFCSWMSYSILWKSDSWFCKFIAVVWSPVVRIAYGLATLLNCSDSTKVCLVAVMETVGGYAVGGVLGLAFGAVVCAVDYAVKCFRLTRSGFTWKQARYVLASFTTEEMLKLSESQGGVISLFKPPPNDPDLIIKINGLCSLRGLPCWKFEDGAWIQVKTIAEATKVITLEELLSSPPPDAISVAPGNPAFCDEKAHDEGSGSDPDREARKKLAQDTRPKAKVIGKKASKKTGNDWRVGYGGSYDDESKRPATTKMSNEQQRVKTKDFVNEYMGGLVTPRPALSTVPVTVDTDHSDFEDQGTCDANCIDVVVKVAQHHTLRIVNKRTLSSCFGVVSGKYCIAPAHMGNMGDQFELRDHLKQVVTQGKMVSRSPDWDLALIECERLFANIDNQFVDDEQFFSANRTMTWLQYFPTRNIFGVVSGEFRTKFECNWISDGVSQPRVLSKRVVTAGISTEGAISQQGDCGGILGVMNARAPKKLVGIHTGGSASNHVTSIVTQNRIKALKTECEMPIFRSEMKISALDLENVYAHAESVEWSDVSVLNPNLAMLMPEDLSEAQHFVGGSLTYIGDTCIVSRPVGMETELLQTPFGNPFPEFTKRPSVLVETDHRVEDIDCLMKDRLGYPSILMTQIAKYSGPDVEVDQVLLDSLVQQLTEHYSLMMSGEELGVPKSLARGMWEAINGNPIDPDYQPLAMKASAGIPWAELGKAKKISLLRPVSTMYHGEKISGYWFDPECTKSMSLAAITEHKILEAQQGRRTHSIWKDCLKDELRDESKIKQGKTRAFTAAPFESVLMMRYLFGRFKAAHKRAFLNLNHALGINPMSTQWADLYNFLTAQGPHVLDGDFSSFDGTIPSQFMYAAGKVIIDTIDDVSHDGMKRAREVMWNEIVETLQLSWSTLYQKHHGNNSGQPLTTPTNCTVVFLLLWYAFAKATQNSSLAYFLEKVNTITFGDDNVSNVSSDVVDSYNPDVIAKTMSELGMTFTSAAKDGSMSWQKIEDVQFLKRKFVKKTATFVLAPLVLESVCSCFNFSMLGQRDYEGWKNTTLEQLLEAALHGHRTYGRVTKSLSAAAKQVRDPKLRKAISPTLAMPYSVAIEKVKERSELSKLIKN